MDTGRGSVNNSRGRSLTGHKQMQSMKQWMVVWSLVGFGLGAWAAPATLRPVELRCEYRRDPLGIDATAPRLSWVLEATRSGARQLRQTGYELLVASSRAKLAADHGDLWRARVAGEQSVLVPYAGRPLASGERCFWKVRVWDQAGQRSGWSGTATWSMGLLHPEDWRGVWIGLDGADSPGVLTDADWIWFPEGAPATAAPVGTRYFRRTVSLPAWRTVRRARLLMTADNEFVLWVNGEQVGGGNNFHAVTVVDLLGRLRSGSNCLAVVGRNVGEAANPAGMIGRLEVEFTEGPPVAVATGPSWKSADRPEPGWEQPGFDDRRWVAARRLGPAGMAPWGPLGLAADRRLPARMLRREFVVRRPVRRATASVCGLGLFEWYLNGQKVGDQVLAPALSDYSKRVFYLTFDVTHQLQPGTNAAGVILGNGRFYAPRLEVPTATRTYGFPKLLFQLRLEYADGTAATVVSDPHWKLTTDGPIRANNEYDGEEYDARQAMAGWAQAGYDDRGWSYARPVAPPGGVLSAQRIAPIRVTQTLSPVARTQPAPGVYIFDLGQNLVGWCRLRVNGPRGQTITLRHAETLRPDGTLYLDNLRSAAVTDRYTLRGGGTEVYEPRFTYHGFRFVEVRGWPGEPQLTDLQGRVVHDDLESAGDFACSNPLLNRVYQNVRWGVRGNYRSIPTDCPQRDERQGWLGDRSAESRGETFLFDTAAFYAKWLQDMADAQKENGSVPDVAPAYWPFYNDNVTWPSSTVIIPGTLYDQYGDAGVLAAHYASMKAWLEHMAGFLQDGLMPRDNYGDWCVPPEEPKLIHSLDPKRKTAGALLGTSYFYHDLCLMAQYATALGRTAEAQHYRALAATVARAFNAKFLNPAAGQYDNGSQTSCVLPLAFGLVPAAERQPVFDHLVSKILGESQEHIGTGLIGGQWLMRVLSDNGRPELAYTLACQKTYPSWGYMVGKGATTIWELWNGDTADPAMNSGNHVMLVGDLLTWLFEDLGGIKSDPAQPGFKHVLMDPTPVGDLQAVAATHRGPYGWIQSRWRRQGGRFAWEVTLPPNTTATLLLPARAVAAVTEGGKPLARVPAVRVRGWAAGHALLTIGSGHYAFQSR